MEFTEKTLSSEYVFKGKVIDVKRDDILVSNGHKSIREVVEHSGGVVILAIKEGKILTVNQFRYPIKTTSIELPAGKLEIGEDPDFASKRELEEETGFKAGKLELLKEVYTSSGYTSEKIYIYLATELTEGNINLDDTEEIIGIEKIAIEEVLELSEKNYFNCAAENLAVLSYYYKYIRK